MENIKDNIFRIVVPLPGNPLRELNSYVIKGERNLVIDTGFNLPECRDALLAGLEELDIDLDMTDVFVTHLHSDHAGLAPLLQRRDTKVYVNELDRHFLIREDFDKVWAEYDSKFLRDGFPPEEINRLMSINPARAYAPAKTCEFTAVRDGDILSYGGYELECVLTGGHTPGHTCLYIRSDKIMFLADHVLFDITPNITAWVGVKDSLRDYCDSLRRTKEYDVEIPLPGHRSVAGDMYSRIDEILSHHEFRLNEACEVVRSHEGITAYDAAGYMTWQIRCSSWSDFPLAQKWFAVGEVISHMDYLLGDGRIRRTLKDGIHRYYTV